MPKGRLSAPPTHNDGIWFSHRGVTQDWPPSRNEDTSTGAMYTAPFKPFTSAYPPSPPHQYTRNDSKNFKMCNRFSSHDNRNSFQSHGVYFGDGHDTRALGKRLVPGQNRQHYTEMDYLKHEGGPRFIRDYTSTFVDNYRGVQTLDPPVHRRFPRIHKEGVPGDTKLSTTAASWFREPDVPYKTPTHVLAVSQEPFLRRNPWKYSNHGLNKCYPPYDRRGKDKPYPTWLIQGNSEELQAS